MADKLMGIYMIKNKINNKKYVGQSSDIYWRWMRHKSDLNNNRHHNKHLQSAWNMYGEENFNFEIIEICDESNINRKEQYWIEKYDSYNSGYNLDLGGSGIRGYKHSQEEIDKMRRIQNPKIVLQFDLTFNLIKEWFGGVSHIRKELKYTKECILLRCEHTILNKMTPYKDSYWIYKEEYDSENFSWDNYFSNVRKWDDVPIYQYDTKFQVIKKWDSHFELREHGYDTVPILRICNHAGTQKTYKGYIWAYEGYDFSDGYFGNHSEYRKGAHNCRPIGMKIDKEGSIIKTFDSISLACDYIGRPQKFRSNIIMSINKGQRASGYYWEYL